MTGSALRIILLFVKEPVPGRVKTRLAATVGAERAAAIYRSLVEHVCSVLPGDATPCVMFDPPDSRVPITNWLSPHLPSRALFEPQSLGDLGARLSAAFDFAFGKGNRVAAIGTDCVEIDEATFSETWQALEHSDCVVGPAEDGGYYLVAMARPLPELFRGIPWSTADTLAVTLERASECGFAVHRLRMLHDVDMESDWTRAAAWIGSPQ